MKNWIIAGIVSVASITTTMGAFAIMVEDRVLLPSALQVFQKATFPNSRK